MDSEALILMMTERMALQRYSPNTIKAYKQYTQVFLQAMSDYTSLKKIPVSEIEGFINRMVKDNKISVSCQRSLVGAIKATQIYTLWIFYKFLEIYSALRMANSGLNLFIEQITSLT